MPTKKNMSVRMCILSIRKQTNFSKIHTLALRITRKLQFFACVFQLCMLRVIDLWTDLQEVIKLIEKANQ